MLDKELISQKISKYGKLKEESKKLEEELKLLSKEIGDALDEAQVKYFETVEETPQVATYSTRVNIKYNDEKAIIEYLKNNGLNNLVEEKIITSTLNGKLKENTKDENKKLEEALKPYYSKNSTYIFTIMSKEDYDKNVLKLNKEKK